MTTYYIFGILSALVFSISYIPYIIEIVRGNTRPHPVSWMLWAILGGVTFYFSIIVGAKETLPLIFLNFLLPLVVGILSLKYFKGKLSKFDILCLILSVVAILFYIIFHDATIAMTLNIVGDLFAYLPTLWKTYKHPEFENLSSWLLYLAGYILSVFSISHWTYGIAVYPLYLVTLGTIMCILILRGRLKKAKNNV